MVLGREWTIQASKAQDKVQKSPDAGTLQDIGSTKVPVSANARQGSKVRNRR